MREVRTKKRNQPAPPHVIFEALTEPHRDPGRPWLTLLYDEIEPAVIECRHPDLVVWSSIWTKRPEARIRYDLTPGGGGTDLRWTLLVDEPVPEEPALGHMSKRIGELINANLRYTFGQ